MKRLGEKIHLLCTALLIGVTYLFPVHVLAHEESVLNFDVVIDVPESGKLDVTENIIYNFGKDAVGKHGIFRTLPKTYKEDNERYRLTIEDVVVLDEHNNKIPFEDRSSRKDYLIRIGDPDKEVSGEKGYKISYTASGVVASFEEFDQIYWNVIDNEFGVPIRSSSLKLILPAQIERSELRIACYVGNYGSRENCENIDVQTRGTTTEVIFSTSDLNSGEGLTVAVGFPKGIAREAVREIAGLSHRTVLAIFVALIALAVGTLMWSLLHWYRKGRDPKGKGVIVRQYDPPANMMPGEMGFIVDEKIDNRDVTAELVYFAERGFMHILAIPKAGMFSFGTDYYLLKLQGASASFKEYQSEIFSAIFSGRHSLSPDETDRLKEGIQKNKKIKVDPVPLVKKIDSADSVVVVSELSSSGGVNSFPQQLQQAKKTLEKSMVDEGYLEVGRETAVWRYSVLIFIGIAMLILSVIIFAESYPLLLLSGIVAGITFIIVGSIMSKSMVRKSLRGVEAKEHALGLKEYLSVAEKDRLEFHFNPKNNPELFERLLPFAIALGVEKLWARELEGVNINPAWYSDASAEAFTIATFSNSFSAFSVASNSGYSVASSASSGGGFSGGGAGGGSVGSW